MQLQDPATAIIGMVIGYLVGSIPTAYIVARWRSGIDIRDYGSRNVGAANVTQHVGRLHGVLVGVFDILAKGVSPVLVARFGGVETEGQALVGLATVLGHNWSIYLRFNGGRGLTVVLGSLLALALKAGVAFFFVGFLGWAIFRSAGLWTGISALLLPVWAIIFGEPTVVILYTVALLAILIVKRLLSNPEDESSKLKIKNKFIARLLYDRDTMGKGDWVTRGPHRGEWRN
jgi:glycerol-3-phosphate acyltransferase PlsY